MKQGQLLKIFVNNSKKHKGELLYEWILHAAKKTGIEGGSAFQSVAGFGSHGKIHEEHFYELGSNVPVMICFALSDEEAKNFLTLLKKEKIDIFYTLHPTSYGHL